MATKIVEKALFTIIGINSYYPPPPINNFRLWAARFVCPLRLSILFLMIMALLISCPNPPDSDQDTPANPSNPTDPNTPFTLPDPAFWFKEGYDNLIDRFTEVSSEGYPDIIDPSGVDTDGAVNCKYVCDQINTRWTTNFIPEAGTANKAANCEYLLTMIDKANEANGDPTSYKTSSYATKQVIDKTAVDDEVSKIILFKPIIWTEPGSYSLVLSAGNYRMTAVSGKGGNGGKGGRGGNSNGSYGVSGAGGSSGASGKKGSYVFNITGPTTVTIIVGRNGANGADGADGNYQYGGGTSVIRGGYGSSYYISGGAVYGGGGGAGGDGGSSGGYSGISDYYVKGGDGGNGGGGGGGEGFPYKAGQGGNGTTGGNGATVSIGAIITNGGAGGTMGNAGGQGKSYKTGSAPPSSSNVMCSGGGGGGGQEGKKASNGSGTDIGGTATTDIPYVAITLE